MSYLQKYGFQRKKVVNIKAFNMITKKNEAKTMAERILRDCHEIKNGTIKDVNVNVKIIISGTKLELWLES